MGSIQSGRTYFWVLMTAALIAACTDSNGPEKLAVPSPENPVQLNTQLIIKFTQALTVAQAAERLEKLGDEHRIRFRLLRQMSGGAFVITVEGVADERRLGALLASLQKRDDVEYVEVDAKMYHQSEPEYQNHAPEAGVF